MLECHEPELQQFLLLYSAESTCRILSQEYLWLRLRKEEKEACAHALLKKRLLEMKREFWNQLGNVQQQSDHQTS